MEATVGELPKKMEERDYEWAQVGAIHRHHVDELYKEIEKKKVCLQIQAEGNLCGVEKKLQEKTKEMDHLLGKITELQRQVVMKELLKKEVEGKGRDLFKQLLEKENDMSDLCSRVYELKRCL